MPIKLPRGEPAMRRVFQFVEARCPESGARDHAQQALRRAALVLKMLQIEKTVAIGELRRGYRPR